MILLFFFYFLVKEKVTDPTQCSFHPFSFHVRGDYTIGLILFQWGWKSWTNCNLFSLPFELTGQVGGTLVAVGGGAAHGEETQRSWQAQKQVYWGFSHTLEKQSLATATQSRRMNVTGLCALSSIDWNVYICDFFFFLKAPGHMY